jgi:hypothetical protein
MGTCQDTDIVNCGGSARVLKKQPVIPSNDRLDQTLVLLRLFVVSSTLAQLQLQLQ